MHLLDRLLRRLVREGCLTVVDRHGGRHVYGRPHARLQPVTIRLRGRGTALRIALNPAMGATLRKLAELKPRTLALMHGPAFSGDCESALLALADDYDRRMMAKARDYGLVPAAA